MGTCLSFVWGSKVAVVVANLTYQDGTAPGIRASPEDLSFLTVSEERVSAQRWVRIHHHYWTVKVMPSWRQVNGTGLQCEGELIPSSDRALPWSRTLRMSKLKAWLLKVLPPPTQFIAQFPYLYSSRILLLFLWSCKVSLVQQLREKRQ